MKRIKNLLVVLLCFIGLVGIYKISFRVIQQNAVLKQVISRLEADSRVAEVLVSGVTFNENDKKTYTTVKFLEYAVDGKPLKPRYFTFSGNIIQFQSLVIRFNDLYIRGGDRLKGKSAYLFWKVFLLDGEKTQEFKITKIDEIPSGYRCQGPDHHFERLLWERFWSYALDPGRAKAAGIKNAQIEAPGTMFVPGHIYTIKIEHDGGMRIDARPLPEILKGESIPKEL